MQKLAVWKNDRFSNANRHTVSVLGSVDWHLSKDGLKEEEGDEEAEEDKEGKEYKED